MTYFKRHIDRFLSEWKNDPHHKPLLLRGARQVGKSSSIRHLAESFSYYIELNLEKRQDLLELFSDNLNIQTLCNQLSAIYNTPIIPGKTLLFIDEIQESQRAIASLRFFYEDFPELHVIAAGSLLEFTLKELPSFGVGRIRSLYVYPFSFDEFLASQNLDILLEQKQAANCQNPLPSALHKVLVQHLRNFYIIGGMPEAVKAWNETHDYRQCAYIHNDLIDTYQDDFKKYKSRIAPTLLSKTLQSVALQAGSKFTYSRVDENIDSKSIKEALSLLSLSGIIQTVTHTAANGIPLGAETNPKYRKYLFIDTGLMQSILGIPAGDLLTGNEQDFVNKGNLSEIFAGLELIKYASPFQKPECFYWHRTEKNAQAEVDYVISLHGNILPIEIKASQSGSMQSLYKFMELKHCQFGIRSNLEAFAAYEKIKVCPLYALSSIDKIVQESL